MFQGWWLFHNHHPGNIDLKAKLSVSTPRKYKTTLAVMKKMHSVSINMHEMHFHGGRQNSLQKLRAIKKQKKYGTDIHTNYSSSINSFEASSSNKLMTLLNTIK